MKEILTCVAGTFAFSVLLKAPKRLLFFTTFGGLISAAVFYFLDSSGKGTFISTLCAMLAITAYAELMARILKTPATVILLPSTVPLLPGSTIYYAMHSALNGNTQQLGYYAAETIKSATGMGLGAVIITVLVHFISSQIRFKPEAKEK